MKKILWIVLFLQLGFANAITIDINSKKISAKPIAIVPFSNSSSKDKFDYIISNNLKKSGVFSPINPNSYTYRPENSKDINYNEFSKLGATYIVVGEKSPSANIVKFTILDVYQKRALGSYTIKYSKKNTRQIAHRISDIILEKLIGIRGAFASKLVYIYESGQGVNHRYKLIISDIDGANSIALVNSKAPLMSPRFSPDGSKIAYVSYEGQNSQIIVQDIKTGFRTLVTKELGINSSPAWSFDGSKIAMVLSKDGNPEIYFKDLISGRLTRVTDNSSIDTEPAWSANNNHIYFTSDRSGTPQIYKINIKNGILTKITRRGSYNAGADISRDNKNLAVLTKQGKQFLIGLINLKSGLFTKVANGFLDETPKFAPNGQMLIFTSVENNKQVLKIVNLDGSLVNTLSVSGNVRDSDWSYYQGN